MEQEREYMENRSTLLAKLEYNQLRCFMEVARRENMSAAAKALYISQPALSQTIKRLEDEWGCPLFDRSGKKIVLNEAGGILYEASLQVNRILMDAKTKTEESLQKAHREVSFVMGCGSMYLPELLKFLRSRTPEVSYRVFQWLDDLQKSQNIGVTAVDGDPFTEEGCKEQDCRVQDGMILEKLFTEDILLAVPSSFDLAGQEKILLDDLREEEFIGLNERWMLGEEIGEHLAQMGFSSNITIWVDNPNLMRELLGDGQGIAFVPAISWKSFAGDKVVMRRVKDCHIQRTICLRYPQNRYLTREQKQCMDLLREFFVEKGKEGPSI